MNEQQIERFLTVIYQRLAEQNGQELTKFEIKKEEK